MSQLEFRNVWKEYGQHVVLENINLMVEEGEFCTIVGASGCGKTTFLRMLLGEESPSRGQIILDGQPLRDEPGPDRGVVFQRYSVFPHLTVLRNVMLFQRYSVFPHLTVLRNVMLGLELQTAPLSGRLFGAARHRAREQACEMLDSVGLGQALDRYPSELSGGMQQRLALAQSLIMKPRILLLDEPFGALDPGIRTDMHKLVLKLWRETGLTVFMITHDLQEGFYLGSRLLVFDRQRTDQQALEAFGANITYDLPLAHTDRGTIEGIRQHVEEEVPRAIEAASG